MDLLELSFECGNTSLQLLMLPGLLRKFYDILGSPNANRFLVAVQVLHKCFGCFSYIRLETVQSSPDHLIAALFQCLPEVFFFEPLINSGLAYASPFASFLDRRCSKQVRN